ncbi:MAG: O-antigen ligase family protein [Sulfuricaulis sp.]
MSNTALIFLFLFSIGLILAFVKNPIYGVLSYMLEFYMSPSQAWWSGEVPDLRWSLLAATVTIIAVLLHPSPDSRPPWYKTASAKWLIALSLWLWIQTPWALDLNDHFFMAALFSKYVLLYAMLYTCLSEPKNIRLFYFTHIIGCFLWGYIAYENPGSGRLENIGFGDVAGSAFASMQLGTGIAFAGFAFLAAYGIWKWIAFFSLPFILNAIVLTATRGAFVGLLGGALASIFFTPRRSRRTVILVMAIAPILLFMLANDLFWSRMSTIMPDVNVGERDASAESRILIAQANFQMFLDHPMGVGHRGNEILSPSYMPVDLLTNKNGTLVRAAHNTFMAILVDHGFIGLILVVLLHFSIARSLIHAKFDSSSGLDKEFSLYVAALGSSLVIYWGNAQFANFTKSEIIIWIAAMASALEAMANTTRQPEDSEATEIKDAVEPDKNQDVTIPSA